MTKDRRPGVQLVRGPFVRLEPNERHCETAEGLSALCRDLRTDESEPLLAADLFSGAGGLGLGLEAAGIRVVIGADHDKEALETHRHHFGGMALDWDLGDANIVEKVAGLIRDNQIDVLAGGPPCQPFSKAGRSGMRFLVREGLRDPHDERRDLWRSFLEIVRLGEPRAVVMENVPDMALDREMFILRSMVFELERLGYTVQERVVEAWRYGVPQFRQRLILVAVRGGAPFEWPVEEPRKVTLANAISDLPPVAGGWRPNGGADGWANYDGPRTAFQRSMREGVCGEDERKVFDHITRPVREDDERAFELLDSESRYSDLPDELKRYRDDIFDDKYKRLAGDDVSRTITAHIAKDGYWYIHPEQNRTLTVREAARVQTFPDWFRFAGPPSAAFKQIGNAVPPRLGFSVGRAVRKSLTTQADRPPSSEQIGSSLASWFREVNRTSSPWLHSTSPWHVILGELAFDRVSTLTATSLWPLMERFTEPEDLIREPERLAEILSWIGRERRVEQLITAARVIASGPDLTDERLDELAAEGVVPAGVTDLARLVTTEGEEPVVVTSGALRIANRFQANPLGRKNQNSAGRIAISKMIGYGPDAKFAQLALLELGTDVCLPVNPICGVCPLEKWCRSNQGPAQSPSDVARSG
ncbi:DNA cytosine methyltransferase [Nakamurella lactea]|uniref:DNA cytosine methyltransferase n=1 Tax=Nakamurella lactea TaxID=459515 RepID=UPI000423A073|nr:DNA cytosine methyltransferase [Nakamurella lactea]